MEAKKVELFRYNRPLLNTIREGILVKLTCFHGRVGWGEAAPLPGFSKETLADVEAELKRLREWEIKFDQEQKVKEEEEKLKDERLRKKEEQIRLRKHSRNYEIEEEVPVQLESFDIDHSKKN